MNRRESIRKVLKGERSARLPRALFGGGLWAYRQAGLRISELENDPRGFAGKLAELYSGLDTDIVFVGSGLNTFPAEAIGGELSFKGEQAPLLAHPIIRKTADARYFEQVDLSESPRTLALVEMIADLRQRLPDRFLCCTSWGPFAWGMVLCDWTLLQERVVSDPAFIREVCELGVRLSSALFRQLVDRGLVDGIVISDGSATLVPLDFYRDTILPCEKKLFHEFAGQGAARLLHQCGAITPQFALYPETGADCISLDAVIELGRAYALYAPNIVTAGNVDVIKTVFGGTPAQICEAVSSSLAGIADPFRNFILMPSCDLPPDTSLGNARAFLACADLVSNRIH
jgi:uroporphyrinogen decarboxylase